MCLFKKISCLMVAVLSTVIMSVSAFAVSYSQPPNPPKDIDLTGFTNVLYDKEFAQKGGNKLVSAIQSKDFSNIVTTASVTESGNFVYNFYYLTDVQINKLVTNGLDLYYTISFDKYYSFILASKTDISANWHIYFDEKKGFNPNVTCNTGIRGTHSYVLQNMTDGRIVDLLKSARKHPYLNDSNSLFNPACLSSSITLDEFINTDSEQSEPKPQEPLVKPSSSGFVVYNTDIWNGFHKKIMGDMGNIVPVCYVLFGIVFGIPFVLYIIRTVVNITTGGDEDV